MGTYQLSCCDDGQVVTISLIGLYSVIIFAFWRSKILHPFKILVVFLHELSHAVAAWITCGKVTGIEVHENEGGVTHYSGGCKLFVLPAGYLGSAFWGMALIICSARDLWAEIISGVLIFCLILMLFYAHNGYLRWLCIGFIVFLGLMLAISILWYQLIAYVTLFIGVMSSLFAVYDIWDDLISRRVNGSDAVAFAAMTHTSSRCWGVIWCLISVCFLVVAVAINLYVYDNGTPLHFSQLASRTKTVVGVSIAVAILSIIFSVWRAKKA